MIHRIDGWDCIYWCKLLKTTRYLSNKADYAQECVQKYGSWKELKFKSPASCASVLPSAKRLLSS